MLVSVLLQQFLQLFRIVKHLGLFEGFVLQSFVLLFLEVELLISNKHRFRLLMGRFSYFGSIDWLIGQDFLGILSYELLTHRRVNEIYERIHVVGVTSIFK